MPGGGVRIVGIYFVFAPTGAGIGDGSVVMPDGVVAIRDVIRSIAHPLFRMRDLGVCTSQVERLDLKTLDWEAT